MTDTAVPTKQRPGDQPLPTQNEHPGVQAAVREDLFDLRNLLDRGLTTAAGWCDADDVEQLTAHVVPATLNLLVEAMSESERLGLERYGTVLQPNNGRSVERDGAEEARDLLVYTRQALLESPDDPEMETAYRMALVLAAFWQQRLAGAVVPGHTRLVTQRALCPECVAGKCGNCPGQALDTISDDLVDCQCTAAEHAAPGPHPAVLVTIEQAAGRVP